MSGTTTKPLATTMNSAAATQPSVTVPPALGPERPVAWPQRAVRTLPNGLQVVLAELRTFPKITAQLFFRSGNASVAHRAPGLAEITATVVRTGTASRTSRQIEEDLRRMGADLGSHAGADSSAISISGLAEFSAGLFDLLADLARNASFPAEEFERERSRKIEGLRIERTTPGFLANERFRRVLFGEHPYAIVSPTEQQVAAIELPQLQDFYSHNYSPMNALLIVVGDFSADAMFAQIEKVFGEWQASPPLAMVSAAPPRHFGRRVHLVHLPGSVQTQVLLGNMAITRRDPDWSRLVLANSIYGGAFHSRLVINIREQKGYTYSPRSGLQSLRQHGYFSVHAAVRNEVAAATLTEIFYEMDRIRSLPVTAEELASARSYLTGVFSLGVATQDGLLGQLSTIYLDQLPENHLETYRQKIHALAADDVLAAARRHFDSTNAQIVLVGDRAQIAEQAALFGEVTEYDAQGNQQK
ncbi:MAG: pitrilysin family protein [Candidatus Acidiferrales bacterium]